ncbi:N-terminal domain of (some) glycogen debranching enzymes [Arthrobacter subterraneus]|uniref:N-terminal domain of (Some) glycogen debranching enzymes n=1 Tax=Arthrobacter subterraneus TaxID=335973 RepID=A0A1G8DJH0_9MICC|nr:glycogen debranching N-terminal domain-containing protein [Arthrobacter subterraneus]SDH57619.1 N-terminal domain of (some) glycogen debranching enzymes [Arthrobacter subterraneus]
MAYLQPFLHNLTGVFSAPVQAWADPYGQIRDSGAQGVHCGDDRVIRSAVLTVNGAEPDWVSTQVRSAQRVDYLHFVRVESNVADPLMYLTRARSAEATGISEQIRLESAYDFPSRQEIRLVLEADNTPMEQVKSGAAGNSGLTVAGPDWNWRDGDTTARLEAPEAQISYDGGRITLTWLVEVEPGGAVELGWRLGVADAGAPMVAPSGPVLTAPTVEGEELQQLLDRSISDLNGLRMATADRPEDAFLAAGAPWFFTMFGRDSLIAARLLLPVDTSLAGSTLRALASRQGECTDPDTAEQPGKILHEVRRGTLSFSEGGSGISLPPVYFGTIDATPLWISLLHDAWRAGLPEKQVEGLLDQLEAALVWLRDHGDSDGDGFLEYKDESGHGLANQGWKDSGDSIRWHDGSLADGPIALAEVQGYAYEAALGGAALLDAFGRSGGDEWRRYAADLQERFRDAFWCTDELGPYPAIALDSSKRAVDGVTSNMGHLLGTGILNDDEARAIAGRLMDPTMFSGYGIRTVSTTNGGFWPTRYHAGSVWSHDTGMIISGLLKDGFTEEASRLAGGLLRAAEGFDWRLPELFSGHPASEVWPPVPYPASCRPQAWAAASSVPIAQALGGL